MAASSSNCESAPVGIHNRRSATPGAEKVDLPRRPVLTFWLIAVALEVVLGVAFLVSGAESAIDGRQASTSALTY
jgi:hypothetical protein